MLGRLSVAAVVLLAWAGTAFAEQKRDIRGFLTGMSEAEVDARIDLKRCSGPTEIKCPQPDNAELTFVFTHGAKRLFRILIFVVRPNPDVDQVRAFVEQTYSVRFRQSETKVQIPGTSDWLSWSLGSAGFSVSIENRQIMREDGPREDRLLNEQRSARPLPKM